MKKSILNKAYTFGLGAVVIGLLVMQFDLFGKDAVAADLVETQNLSSNQENFNSNSYNIVNTVSNEEIQNTNNGEVTASVVDGVQVIEFDLQPNSYPTLNVKAGMPVKLIINADENSLNSCNYSLVSYDLNIFADLNYGENVIEFTPANEGQYVYTCWMGMLGANINVSSDQEAPEAFYGPNVASSSCCSR